MNFRFARILDIALKSFENGILIQDYYANGLPMDNDIVDFLVSDGSLKRDKYLFQITYKGRMRINGKGFVREYRMQFLTHIASIVAAVASVITLVAYFVEKLCFS